jgi:hypothetical protein
LSVEDFMKRTTAFVAGILFALASCWSEPLLAQQSAPEPGSPTQQAPASPSTMQPPPELPENPGSQNPSSKAQQPQAPPTESKPGEQQPSGTAVAPPIEVSGGAASKPAGVAIAPPKQRQIRSLLIKFGFLAGAGVAIGTVVGLSAASSGRVPNSPGH